VTIVSSVVDSVLVSSLGNDDLDFLVSGAFNNELDVIISCGAIVPFTDDGSSSLSTVGVLDSLESVGSGGDGDGCWGCFCSGTGDTSNSYGVGWRSLESNKGSTTIASGKGSCSSAINGFPWNFESVVSVANWISPNEAGKLLLRRTEVLDIGDGKEGFRSAGTGSSLRRWTRRNIGQWNSSSVRNSHGDGHSHGTRPSHGH